MSVNNVLLVGRLGNAPELRRTESGKAVCNFSIATDRRRGESPDWHRIVAWERTAETCERFLDKGRLVAVEGRLSNRKWVGKDGSARWTTEVIAGRVTFLGSRDDRTVDGDAKQAGPLPLPVHQPTMGMAAGEDLPF